jgi:hypothetical protein
VKSLSDVASASSGTSGFLAGVALTRLEKDNERPDEDGPAQLLGDISFVVHRGEMVAIAGHSGSGKSTIVSLACGAIRPSHGRVSVCGGAHGGDHWPPVAAPASEESDGVADGAQGLPGRSLRTARDCEAACRCHLAK